MSNTIIEEREYEISVTITFSTRVSFAPIERDRPITSEDALETFYGYGLSEAMESGEYNVDVDSKSIEVREVGR